MEKTLLAKYTEYEKGLNALKIRLTARADELQELICSTDDDDQALEYQEEWETIQDKLEEL